MLPLLKMANGGVANALFLGQFTLAHACGEPTFLDPLCQKVKNILISS